MLIYYFLFCYIIVVTMVNKRIKLVGFCERKQNIISMVLILIPLWLVMGLRYNVGRDFLSYESILKIVSEGNMERLGHIEKGYLYFNYLLSKISSQSILLFLTTSLIIVFFFLLAIYEHSANILISILLFFSFGYYFNAMNLIRQFIAIAISFYALKYIKRELLWKFWICVLIAAIFHQSVLIYIPLSLLMIYLSDKLFYTLSALLMFIIGSLGTLFLYRLQNIAMFTKFVVYNVTARRVSVLNIAIATIVFVAQMLLYKYRNLSEEKKNMMKLNWLSLMAFIFLTGWGDATTRFAFYFTPVYILIIPDIIEVQKEKIIRSFLTILVILICFIYLYTMLINSVGNNNFYPYRSIFTM